jgi:hypothetical protein
MQGREVRPNLFNEAHVEHANTQLETLQSIWAEIRHVETRKRSKLAESSIFITRI